MKQLLCEWIKLDWNRIIRFRSCCFHLKKLKKNNSCFIRCNLYRTSHIEQVKSHCTCRLNEWHFLLVDRQKERCSQQVVDELEAHKTVTWRMNWFVLECEARMISFRIPSIPSRRSFFLRTLRPFTRRCVVCAGTDVRNDRSLDEFVLAL